MTVGYGMGFSVGECHSTQGGSDGAKFGFDMGRGGGGVCTRWLFLSVAELSSVWKGGKGLSCDVCKMSFIRPRD